MFKKFLIEQEQQNNQEQQEQAEVVKKILLKVSNPENIKKAMANIANELGYDVSELKNIGINEFNSKVAELRVIQDLEIQAKQLKAQLNQKQEGFFGDLLTGIGGLISGIWNTAWSVLKHILSPIQYLLSGYFNHGDKITNTALLVLIYAVATGVGGPLPGVMGIYGFLWFHKNIITPPLQSLSNAGMA